MPRSTTSAESTKKKKLSEKIDKLSSIEHGEIFRKLKNHNIGFTQNSNGVFIDITDVPMEIINELIVFVDHCIENQKMLKSSRQHQFKISLKPQQSIQTKNHLNQQIQIDIDETVDNTRQDIEDDVLLSQESQEVHPVVLDPIKKSGSRFHNTRKKYSRPVATKVVYVNDLRKE
jgi:hypothetical protein